jgi:GntR family transcriptional regulator
VVKNADMTYPYLYPPLFAVPFQVYSVSRHSTMYITIDESDRRPIYRQVADEIKGLIARGELHEGMALPPVRQVADDLGVNLNTIAAAYRELQKEGLLSVRHGSGALVSARRVSQQNDAELRKGLRASLAHLALAGLPRSEIVEIVNEEIRHLFKRER